MQSQYHHEADQRWSFQFQIEILPDEGDDKGDGAHPGQLEKESLEVMKRQKDGMITTLGFNYDVVTEKLMEEEESHTK